MAEPLLKLHNVTAGYGDAVVLHGISVELPENGSLAVLGRNGVGKSTLLLTIMGYTQLRGGQIAWRGILFNGFGAQGGRKHRPGDCRDQEERRPGPGSFETGVSGIGPAIGYPRPEFAGLVAGPPAGLSSRFPFRLTGVGIGMPTS